ncbi:hypothetical protein CRUP_030201 [Coryphaenoides rupestris]|nr:hypothetical protein CRUP_030201 [Coryphaenoides rupestris]
MSEALNDVLRRQLPAGPHLTWQYFGIKWTPDDNGVGLRLTIAKHTINTILDTLGENDFVNIIAYSDYVSYSAGQGSLCNQAIMLITDGAMEDFQDVFEEFNWPDRRVRVFTYLIGREMTFADNVKWIACNNKGYYTHISTLADVQENVMEYLHVLSRPMVINHDRDIIWTEAYMDSVLFNTQAQSLLLMTSVAMPVFSKKEETLSHGILLGVVGTDVALRELIRLAPRYKLGIHGYAFLNTNNGYILSHPELRPLYKEGKKLKPKPNYNSVDLAEVEWEDKEEILRTAMVKGETGSLSLDVTTSVDKGRRVMFLRNEYSYTVLNNTPFSLGIVLTKGHGQYKFIGNVSVEEAVVDYLTGKEPDLDCDMELLSQALFDAVVTAPMEAYWTAIMLNTSRSFLTESDKQNIFTLDHFPVWYRRAAETPTGQFLYYLPRDDSRAIGVQMTLEMLESKFMETTAQAGRFFGEVDGSVMATLIRMGMFKRVPLFDYQAMCKMNLHSSNSARPLLSKRGDILQPCDTEYPSFLHEPSVKETNSLIKCGRMFVVQQVPDSNLLMLVVQADCDCSKQYPPITMEPQEVKYILPQCACECVCVSVCLCVCVCVCVQHIMPPVVRLCSQRREENNFLTAL